ncbi:MAG: HEPN domain-containing protein [Oscillospiraceae bacterium]
MRRNRKSDSHIFYQWLDSSYEDILAAKLLKEYKDCYKLALFHCHQCIEKALKSYILFKTKALTDGHNLTFLCKKAINLDPAFDQWIDESISLNKCYIETRYPSDIPSEVTEKEVNIAFTMADNMFTFVCKELEAEFI